MRRAFGMVGFLVAVMATQAQLVPDFSLLDINPASPRYGTTVSPRNYRLQVSGYFFGGFG